jgi:hypothetical protein
MTIVEWSLYSQFQVDKSLSGDLSSGIPQAVLQEFCNSDIVAFFLFANPQIQESIPARCFGRVLNFLVPACSIRRAPQTLFAIYFELVRTSFYCRVIINFPA